MPLPDLLRARPADDGTCCYALRLADGAVVECVAMPEPTGGFRLCLSTQVGCPVGCHFCASGMQGFERSLTGAELLGCFGAVSAARGAAAHRVVFMGTGEPLLAPDALCEALAGLRGLGLGRSRVTVSTIGLPKAMDRLAELSHPPGLALSLHASCDATRTRLIPLAAAHPLGPTLEALSRYATKARRRAIVAYLLLAGVNDGEDDAQQLVRLLEGRPVKVNLLRYNPVPGAPFEACPGTREDAFAAILYTQGLHVTRRTSRGLAIRAACGQLSRQLRAADPTPRIPMNAHAEASPG